ATRPPAPPPFPSTTLFRSQRPHRHRHVDLDDLTGPVVHRRHDPFVPHGVGEHPPVGTAHLHVIRVHQALHQRLTEPEGRLHDDRSEEHTSELQSRGHLVCR